MRRENALAVLLQLRVYLEVNLKDGDSKKISGGGEVATATRLAAV